MIRSLPVFVLAAVVVGKSAPPPSPCPGVFSYVAKESEVSGRANIPYDGATVLNLEVNASFAGSFKRSNNIQVKLDSPPNLSVPSAGQMLIYTVNFPYQDVIPKITQIRYNNKVFCSGPSEPLIPGSAGVTNSWASHQYMFFTSKDNVVQEPEDEHKEPDVANNPPKVSKSNAQYYGQCGVGETIQPLILGGEGLSDGVFPWLAALLTSKGSGYEYKCTANLISDRHVVTAARCVQFFKVQIVRTEDILLVFGKVNIEQWATNGAITRGAKRVQAHPEYDQNTAHGDIAIITLDRPVEFSQTIAPVCLWNEDEDLSNFVNKDGVLAGWGMDEKAQKSGLLSVTEASSITIPIVATDECLFSNFTFATLTSDMTFCAGKRDGRGPCIGDSGAGFCINKDGKFYLRGLASLTLSNNGKCDLQNFVIFCDVAKCKKWIQSVLES